MRNFKYILPVMIGALSISIYQPPATASGVLLKPAPAGCLNVIQDDDGTLTTTNRCDAYFMIAFCVREERTANSRLYMRPNIVPNGEDNFSPFTVSNVKFTYTLLTGQLATDEEWDPKC